MAEKETKTVEHPNIYAALSAFQGELKPIATVEADLKSYKITYSPLGKIMEAVLPLLSKHGLSVRHEISKEGVECILTHTTTTRNFEKAALSIAPTSEGSTEVIHGYNVATNNEIRSGKIAVPTTGMMKDLGAAITYAKRFSISMVLGISSEEDKDVAFEEEAKKNAGGFAYKTAKQGIEKIALPKLKERMDFFANEIKLIQAKKAPSIGLTEEQYEELIMIGQERLNENQEALDTEKVIKAK